jgi:hypothetical protein
MPKVGTTHYAYTKTGYADAKKARLQKAAAKALKLKEKK